MATQFGLIKTGQCVQSILIDNIYHIIGGYYNNLHITHDINKNDALFIKKNEFDKCFTDGRLVYNECSNQILYVGGYINGKPTDLIHFYDKNRKMA